MPTELLKVVRRVKLVADLVYVPTGEKIVEGASESACEEAMRVLADAWAAASDGPKKTEREEIGDGNNT